MSGTGPRFTWDSTSDFILLFSLLSDTKIGSGGWDAASAKLAEKGFLSSDGNPIKASAISQHYTKLRAQIMKLAAESTSTSIGDSSPPATAAEVTPATPKRTRTGRAKQTEEQKAAAKAAREAKKAATPTKERRKSVLGISKESSCVDSVDGSEMCDSAVKYDGTGGTAKEEEEDSDEPMANKTASKKRRMSSVVKKVEETSIQDKSDASAGSAEMDISDSQ